MTTYPTVPAVPAVPTVPLYTSFVEKSEVRSDRQTVVELLTEALEELEKAADIDSITETALERAELTRVKDATGITISLDIFDVDEELFIPFADIVPGDFYPNGPEDMTKSTEVEFLDLVVNNLDANLHDLNEFIIRLTAIRTAAAEQLVKLKEETNS